MAFWSGCVQHWLNMLSGPEEQEGSIRLRVLVFFFIRQCFHSIAAISRCGQSACCFIWRSYWRSLLVFVQTSSVCLKSSCSSGPPDARRESKQNWFYFKKKGLFYFHCLCSSAFQRVDLYESCIFLSLGWFTQHIYIQVPQIEVLWLRC